MSEVIQHIRRAMLLWDRADMTDGQLLERFISNRDEAALGAIVRRHGPMVWGVCRRVLGKHHDAEDAFQATFLVLVRKAASIMPREVVANWLYGVAHQTSLKARATTTKRRAREKQVNEMPESKAVAEPELWRDLQPLLDQELSRLPDKYRVAIILCDLEGKKRNEVARQLKIPEGTLSSRLTTARRMLAKRLGRHGLPVSGGALAGMLSQKMGSACVPPAIVFSTINVATQLAAGQTVRGMISMKVAALTEGVLKSMLLTKLKCATAILLVATLACCCVSALTYTVLAGGQSESAKEAKRVEPKPKPNTQEDQLKSLIDKVIKAHGGERVSKLKAFSEKTRASANGREWVNEHFAQLPYQLREEQEKKIAGKTVKSVWVMNGEQRWQKTGDEETEELSNDETEIKFFKEWFDSYFNSYGPARWIRLKDLVSKLSPLEETTIGDQPAVGVKFTPTEGSETRLFFDKKTGLLLKEFVGERTTKDGRYQVTIGPYEVIYGDYKEVKGVPIAHKIVNKSGGIVTGEREVLEFKIVDELDAKLFQKP